MRRTIRRLIQRLYGKGVAITARPQQNDVPWFVSLLVSWLPFIALIGVWIFLSRQMQGAGGKALGFGKIARQASDRGAWPRHLRGRRRRRRGQAGPAGDRRIPARSRQIPAARRQDSARRAAGRPARHRQDADRARGRRRSQRAVLHHFRLRLRRDVRRRRRLAACATCSSRPRRTRPASSSSTKSTRSAAIAAPASAAATTSASRRSTSCWSRWTASRPTKASS